MLATSNTWGWSSFGFLLLCSGWMFQHFEVTYCLHPRSNCTGLGTCWCEMVKKYTVHHAEWDRQLPSFLDNIYSRIGTPWITQHPEKWLTQIYTWMQGYTTQRTNVHCCPPYRTGTRSDVTRRVSRPPSITTDSSKDIKHTPQLLEHIRPLEECHKTVAFLPLIQNTFYHIRRVLSKHNINMLGLPLRKISKLLQPLKDDLGLKSAGIQSAASV